VTFHLEFYLGETEKSYRAKSRL